MCGGREGGRARGRDGQPGHQSQLTSGGGREAAAGLKWARERERERDMQTPRFPSEIWKTNRGKPGKPKPMKEAIPGK